MELNNRVDRQESGGERNGSERNEFETETDDENGPKGSSRV